MQRSVKRYRPAADGTPSTEATMSSAVGGCDEGGGDGGVGSGMGISPLDTAFPCCACNLVTRLYPSAYSGLQMGCLWSSIWASRNSSLKGSDRGPSASKACCIFASACW